MPGNDEGKTFQPSAMPPSLEKSEQLRFWAAREGARRSVLLTMIGGVVFVQLCDTRKTHIMAPLLLIVPVLLIMITNGKCTTQFMFDFIVTFLSSGMCLQVTKLSMNLDMDPTSMHIADEVLVNTMKRGIIPIMTWFGVLIPVLAVPIGMTLKVAKMITLLNVAASINTCYHIYLSIDASELSNRLDLGRFQFNILTFFILTSTAAQSCFSAAEIVNQFIKRLDSDHKADAMLNNVLKNSIAGAACLLEIEQDEMDACGKCGVRHRLTQARNQLLHSMRWCTSRQLMVELASGSYKSVKTSVDVHCFLDEVSTGFENCETVSDGADLDGDNVYILFDEAMARMAVENSLFKVVSLGDGKVKLQARLHQADNTIEFVITNDSNDISPRGKLQQRIEHQHVSSLELAKDHSSISLNRIKMAVNGANGSLVIQYNIEHATVALAISLPIELVRHSDSSKITGLKATVSLEPSPVHEAHNNTDATISSYLATSSTLNESLGELRIANLKPFGDAMDLKRKLDGPYEGHGMQKRVRVISDELFPSNLKLCAIDDSKLICKGYERLLLPQLNCNLNESYVCCPKQRQEVDAFVQFVLGHNKSEIRGGGGEEGGGSGSESKAADIVILDQNIDLSLENGAATVLGTDLAVLLRQHAFVGLIIIRSANSNASDFHFYMKSRAVNFCVGKSESHLDLAAKIRAGFEKVRS